MTFPISGTHIQPLVLVLIGLVVGLLGGFFGVGGSFIAGPSLFSLGVPMNFVIGTDLAHIVGKSIVAVSKHHSLGHLDYKLGALMLIGSIPGVELGAQLIERLKMSSRINLVVGVTFIVVLLSVAGFMAWECWQVFRSSRRPPAAARGGPAGEGRRGFARLARSIQRVGLPPYVRLPVSGISRISLWSIVGVSLVGGFFSGFLGGGAGYVRMPSMIYLLGIPTHIAVGTDLLEVIVSAGYGTFSHAMKGNVDIMIALIMHTGAAIGAQAGAMLTPHFSGARMRLAFIPLPLIGAGLLLYGLLTGRPVQS